MPLVYCDALYCGDVGGACVSEELVDAAALTLRFVLAFVFLTAAVPKLLAPGEFRRAVANYALLPARLIAPVSTWLPWLELLCGLALLLGVAVLPVAILAGFLLLVFAVAVGANLMRGRQIDCGCFSSVAPRQIGWGLVAGDLALAGMAVAVAVRNPDVLAVDTQRASSSVSSEDGMATLIVAASLVLAYLVLSSLRALRTAIRAVDAREGAARG